MNTVPSTLSRVPRTPEEFFEDSRTGFGIFAAIEGIVAGFDAVETRVSKSQIAFRALRGFAYVWRPSRYLHTDVPVVLSIALPERVDSPRFKSIVNPSKGAWIHHLELRSVADVDDEVASWLLLAYRSRAAKEGLLR